MNSGDAADTVRRWQDGSTPAVLAHVAMERPERPIEIRLHERHSGNRDFLLQMLSQELPGLVAIGRYQWERYSSIEWHFGNVILTVEGDSNVFHDFPTDAHVLVVHDPNSFAGWTMGTDVLISLDKMDHVTTFSALGFNTTSRRGLNQPHWQDKVALLELLMGMAAESLLMFLDPGDNQRWAYLVTTQSGRVHDLEERIRTVVRCKMLSLIEHVSPESFGRAVGVLTAA